MSIRSNVLVTGGLGFIGSHFVKLLAREGYYPVILDLDTYAADTRRIQCNDYEDELFIGDRLFIGDICDIRLVEDIIQKYDITSVVNFAAETHVDNSINDSRQFIHSNIVGVHNLLEIVRENDLRFVQISTDEVYGSTTYDDQSFKETDKLNPGNPYSASKASADLLTLSYFNTYNSNVVITRSSNNYGPWQHNEKFIPRMISLAMEGKDLEVYGTGNNVRDWLCVTDNVLAIKKVMEEGRTGDIYNIGAGEEKTNNDIAELIADKFGVWVKHIEDRKGHDFRYSINCNKIWSELSWDTKTTFEDGIKKTIDWYKNQRG